MSAYEVLKISPFRNFIFARLFFTFAVNMMGTIVGWQVYEYTHDSLALGFIGLAEVIPFVFVALYGGHIADIINRKLIIIASVCLYILCAITLFIMSWQFSYLFTTIGVMPIYLIIFVTGLARGFLAPAQSAFMAQLVPRDLYANSATWNSIVWHTSAIGGPAIGGLLYGVGKAPLTYGLVVALSLTGLLLFGLVPQQPMPERVVGESVWERIRVGLQFVFNHQIVLGALALDMFAVLFGGAVAVLPIFAEEVLHEGAMGLGLLRAAPAAGALVMAGVMAYHPPLKNAGRNLLLSIAGFGLCTIGFALSPNFYLSLLLLVGIGMFDNVSVVLRSTIFQLYTPEDMRGRVSSVNSIFISSSNELGAFESGVAAKLMGLVPSVIFGGGMTLAVVAVTARIAPLLRRLDLRKEMHS